MVPTRASTRGPRRPPRPPLRAVARGARRTRNGRRAPSRAVARGARRRCNRCNGHDHAARSREPAHLAHVGRVTVAARPREPAHVAHVATANAESCPLLQDCRPRHTHLSNVCKISRLIPALTCILRSMYVTLAQPNPNVLCGDLPPASRHRDARSPPPLPLRTAFAPPRA